MILHELHFLIAIAPKQRYNRRIELIDKGGIFMKLSVQTAPILEQFGIDKGFEMIRDAGFEAVDWNIDVWLPYADIIHGVHTGVFSRSDEEILAACRPYKEAAQRCGLSFTQAHAPFPNRVVGDDESTAFVLRAVQKTIMCCGEMGCKNLIVHPAHNRDVQSISLQDEWDFNIRMYTALIPDLKKYGVTCCLENMFWGWRGKIMQSACDTPYEAVRYIDTLNEIAGERLFGFCLDIGHAMLVGQDVYAFVMELGDRLQALHVHDNNGLEDQHRFPYMGITDWNRFCQALKDVGYRGDLSFETCHSMEEFDNALAPEMLSLLSATGRLFRSRIQD